MVEQFAYKIPLVFEPQPEGDYTVTCPILPELITEGDTITKALVNVEDALMAIVEAYEDLNRPPASCVIDPASLQSYSRTPPSHPLLIRPEHCARQQHVGQELVIPRRVHETYYVDFADRQRCACGEPGRTIGLNLLDMALGLDVDKVVSDLIGLSEAEGVEVLGAANGSGLALRDQDTGADQRPARGDGVARTAVHDPGRAPAAPGPS